MTTPAAGARADKHAGGRPTVYEARFARMARVLTRLGATNEDVAECLGVALSTIGLWLIRHRGFSDALKEGRQRADARVERALFERAVGYSHADVAINTVAIGGGRSQVVQTPFVKRLPPDPTSCIFWLKNRVPARWRDKVALEHEIDYAAIIKTARERADLVAPVYAPSQEESH
jgi:hypothetical protein